MWETLAATDKEKKKRQSVGTGKDVTGTETWLCQSRDWTLGFSHREAISGLGEKSSRGSQKIV